MRTTRGDAERILVRPRLCQYDARHPASCSELAFGTKGGTLAVDLLPRIRTLPGWLSGVSAPGDVGFVEVFGNTTVVEAVRRIREWDETKFVEPKGPDLSLPEYSTAPSRLAVRGLVPLKFQEPRVGDGIVDVLAGDSLIVEYRQPDGSVLRDGVLVACEEYPRGALGRPPVVPIKSATK